MTNVASNILALVLVLGFLVFAHEAGHFLFAKLFRVRVLVFSLGFGKRLFGFKRGDTDYRVSLIPLGGYVRMAGDNPEEATTSDPSDFLSKPKWQRFLILLAGPAINLVIAVAFLTGFNMIGAEVLRDSVPVIGEVIPGRPAAEAGILKGDRVIEANGEPIESWDDFKLVISMNSNTPVHLKVERNGGVMDITVTPEQQMTDYGVTGIVGVMPYISTVVGRAFPDSAADRAGLLEGDRIVAVNGKPVTQLSELDQAISAANGAAVSLTVDRNGRAVQLSLPSAKSVPKNYPGIVPPTKLRKLGFRDAIADSLQQNRKMMRYTFMTLARMFRGSGSVKEFSGPINIARISGEMLRIGWRATIFLMANISLQLGILNLLPVPMLDGGHIFILGIEGIAGRDLSVRVKERIQQVGFVALAVLMLVVIYNDVIQNVMRMKNG